MAHLFNYKDEVISVTLENEAFGHYAEIDKAGVKRRYTLMQFFPDFNRKSIRVEYNIIFYDQDDKEIGVPVKKSYVVPADEFDLFYAMPVATTLGNAIAFNLMNGLLFREFGVRCFAADGSFYQPIVFEVAVEEATATAEVFQGTAPYQVSLDGVSWEDGLELTLNEGQNRFIIKDSNGTANYKDIYK